MTTGWIFHHNWAMRVSKCLVLCKNPTKKNQKYKIEFHFIGAQTYSVEFADKKARDNHFRFLIRMMEQGYANPIKDNFHWAAHVLCLCVIMIMGTICLYIK